MAWAAMDLAAGKHFLVAVTNKASMRLLRSGALATVAAVLFALPVRADADLRLPRVVVANGGPYVAASYALQKFSGAIAIPNEYLRQPLSMVCSNGSESAPGFSWVRLFLLPDKSDQDFQRLAEPVGRLLVDENSFLASAQIYLDMSGQFRPGRNNIFVEGAGAAGSEFSFEIRSIGKPQLYLPDSVSTAAGAWFQIPGAGFSLRPDENLVQIGPMRMPVGSSNFSALNIYIPKDFPSGTYELSVSLRDYKSRVVKVQIVQPRSHSQ